MKLFISKILILFINIRLKINFFSYKINIKNLNQILNISYHFKLLNQIHNKGYDILYNQFHYHNKIYSFNHFNQKYSVANYYFYNFFWLVDLKNINTNQSYEKSYQLLNFWLQYNNSSYSLNDLSTISERVFNIIISYKFLTNFNNNIFLNKLLLNIKKEIEYLMNSYHKKFYKLYLQDNIIIFFKTILLLEFTTNGSSLSSIIKDLNNHLKIHIYDDGGHISHNISTSLMYLQNLLIIKDMLKEDLNNDLSIINLYIDKISLFIKVLKHKDNSLAIFNKSNDTDIDQINILLSLNNTANSSNYNNLKDSKYINLKHNDNNIIVSYFCKNNTFFPIEATLNKEKIITNIPSELFENSIENLQCSTLILELENNNSYIVPKNNNISIQKRDEDNWQIIELSYEANEYGLIYRKIIYLSKNKKNNYILGEDLLSFYKANNLKKIKNAYLRFHLTPSINSVETYKNNHIALLQTKNNIYSFNSPDNAIKFHKTLYSEKNSVYSYTFDIPFNLQAKIIKNEWNLCSIKSEIDFLNT